jgi:hypothetical protein
MGRFINKNRIITSVKPDTADFRRTALEKCVEILVRVCLTRYAVMCAFSFVM